MKNYFAYPVAAAADMPKSNGNIMRMNGVPVPPIEEGGMPVYPGENMPVPPIEEGGTPVYPGENYPVPPIEEGGRPVYPGDNYPVPPIEEGGMPVYPNPGQPSPPNRPGFPGIVIPIPPLGGSAEVRFLHAAINAVPVTISIDSRTVASDLSYAGATAYTRIADGYRTVTVMSARAPRAILFRQNLPFRAGDKTTIAIINSANGIELLQISDNICTGCQAGNAYFRMANLSYNSVPVDLLLFDGRIVFADVHFKEVTPYRRARPGEYGFYVAVTPANIPMPLGVDTDIETMEAMPVPVAENYVPGYGNLEPLTTFYEYFRPGVAYTSYLLGVGGNATYPYTIVTLTNQ